MLFTVLILILITLFLYPLTVYPLLLIILDKLFGKEYQIKAGFYPEITILIAAYNEEDMIGDCINSILKSDYPLDNIKIIVGSDGSVDNTYNIVKDMSKQYPNIEIYQYNRLGKNGVLNELYKHINTEFVMFMDADFRFRNNTISLNIENYINPDVHCVMSKIVTVSNKDNQNSGSVGEGAYHKLEHFYKNKESRIWTTVNNIGSYSIRTISLKPIPNSKVCDDMFNILNVSLSSKRAIYCNNSIIDEIREKFANEELHRRIRLATGQFETVKALIQVLNPFNGYVALFFISHKFIRYIYPIIMFFIALLTPFIIYENQLLFRLLAFVQMLFYLLGLIGYILDKRNITKKIFSIPYYFITINLGFLLGIFKFLFGKSSSTWERMDTRNIGTVDTGNETSN
jgi:poly-beta-1,6-N-acetyl-D-glucosamine synthase